MRHSWWRRAREEGEWTVRGEVCTKAEEKSLYRGTVFIIMHGCMN